MRPRHRHRAVTMRSPRKAVLLISLLVSACGPGSLNASPSSASALPSASGPAASNTGSSEPVGVAVIGHSGATGYDSDPDRPGEDVKANSWATGTNPQVQSIYLRMLATNPSLEGHATNIAVDGSNVSSLIGQASQLVEKTPKPQLVLIQTIDNDQKCDGTDAANYEPYRTKLTEVLDTLAKSLPGAQIFIVSQWADVKTYDRVVFAINPSHFAGDGPCETVNPKTMQIDPAKEAYLQGLVDGYWKIVTDVCALYPTCRTDGGAMQHFDLKPEDLSSDRNHLSAAGHAKMAAMVWAVLSGS
jgi:lysophospholipase L1-like esterase